jgi:hypothetical protein
MQNGEGNNILNLNEHFLKIWVKKQPGNVNHSRMNIKKMHFTAWNILSTVVYIYDSSSLKANYNAK